MDVCRHIRDILGKDNSEATSDSALISMIGNILRENYRHFQVPVDVAVEEPGPGVVRKEPNRDFVSSITNAHDIPDNGVVEIVGFTTGTADHMEVMPVQMNRVLSREVTAISSTTFHLQSRKLTGPPAAPAGMVSSTLLFASRG